MNTPFAPIDLVAGAVALACSTAVVLATARDAIAVLGPAAATSAHPVALAPPTR
jgi:hypothetical protein